MRDCDVGGGVAGRCHRMPTRQTRFCMRPAMGHLGRRAGMGWKVETAPTMSREKKQAALWYAGYTEWYSPAFMIYRRRPKENKGGEKHGMQDRIRTYSGLHRYNITKVTLFHTLHCRAADVLRMTCGVKQEPSPFPPPSKTNAFSFPRQAASPGRRPPSPFPQNINRAILNFAV